MKQFQTTVDQKHYKVLERNYQSLVEIIEDVRKLQAFDDKKIELEFKDEFVSKIVEDLEIIFSEKLSTKNIKLKIINNVDKKEKIKVDLSILKNQILNNLLSNAIKFSPEGSSISIVINIVHNFLEIDIIDNGCGIDTINIQKYFNFNEQTSTKGTGGETGTGYGLPIAKFFTNKMNGDLIVLTKDNNTEIKQGTCFKIKLPIN